MSDYFSDYFGALLHDCLQAPTAAVHRTDFADLLTDDVRLHALQCGRAADEWARAEGHTPMTITATHIVATEYGLIYAAVLAAPGCTTRHYLATPHRLFDRIADRVHDAPPVLGAAAVDCRLDHDLTSMWQFESGLRRLLDDYPLLELELAGDQ